LHVGKDARLAFCNTIEILFMELDEIGEDVCPEDGVLPGECIDLLLDRVTLPCCSVGKRRGRRRWQCRRRRRVLETEDDEAHPRAFHDGDTGEWALERNGPILSLVRRDDGSVDRSLEPTF